MRRAKSTVLCGLPNHPTAGKGWWVRFICGFLLILAGAVSGKPSPAPAVADNSVIVVGLWQTAASLIGLSPGAQLQQAAAHGALADYPDRPYRRLRLHHFKLPCRTCHVSTPDTRPTALRRSPPARIGANVNDACASGGCHVYDRSFNHPVDVAVPAPERLPSYIPLDHADRIDCLTCHTDPRPPTDADESMLIVPDGEDLCNSCHVQMQTSGRTPAHWRFSNKAHLQSINPRKGSTSRVDVSFGRIDPESMTCVSCHDEITVTVPQENETHRQRMTRWTSMPDHAIGMRYAAIVARRRGQFNYPPIDSERIRLFDGKVGCGSCHSVYADNPAYLATKQNDNRLCRNCHIK